MRVNEDYETWNAASQVDDERSVRAFWKRALQLRKDHKVLVRTLYICLSSRIQTNSLTT
jgi:glycosidase